MHETSALSPFGTFQFDLDRGWAGVWVRDSGVVGQALREESEYFIWGLKMLREKTRQNCYIFFSSILDYMHLLALIFQRSGICVYNHGFGVVCLEAS